MQRWVCFVLSCSGLLCFAKLAAKKQTNKSGSFAEVDAKKKREKKGGQFCKSCSGRWEFCKGCRRKKNKKGLLHKFGVKGSGSSAKAAAKRKKKSESFAEITAKIGGLGEVAAEKRTFA